MQNCNFTMFIEPDDFNVSLFKPKDTGGKNNVANILSKAFIFFADEAQEKQELDSFKRFLNNKDLKSNI